VTEPALLADPLPADRAHLFDVELEAFCILVQLHMRIKERVLLFVVESETTMGMQHCNLHPLLKIRGPAGLGFVEPRQAVPQSFCP
jgi:hypothetical protein